MSKEATGVASYASSSTDCVSRAVLPIFVVIIFVVLVFIESCGFPRSKPRPRPCTRPRPVRGSVQFFRLNGLVPDMTDSMQSLEMRVGQTGHISPCPCFSHQRGKVKQHHGFEDVKIYRDGINSLVCTCA